MTSYGNTAALAFGIMTAFALSLGTATAEVDELNVLAPAKDFPKVWRQYSDMDPTFERSGTARSVAQVRKVTIGQTKKALVASVGRPVSAYKDGSWNFNLALPLPQKNRIICQYRVFFDDQDRVAGTIWRRPQCANLVTRNGKVSQ